MKTWAWGVVVGGAVGAAAITWMLDSDGIINVRKFFGGDGLENYDAPRATDENIQDLRQRVLADLIYVPEGSFKFGNVPVPVILDGTPRKELILGPVVDPDRAPIDVNAFYMSRFEVTNHDFDLYADAKDLPLRSDDLGGHKRQGPYPAIIAHHQAIGFCEWLSEITDQSFDLPSSEQWEFAARSGGRDVAYATQDGTYDYLEALYQETIDEQPYSTHLPDAYPPNPYGFYAMSSNVAEWVKDDWVDTNGFALEEGATPDPMARDRRVWRGGTFTSQASLASLYRIGAAGPSLKERTLDLNDALAPLFEPNHELIYHGFDIGARCVVNLTSPPDVSGFGRSAGQVPDDFPSAFAPLAPR